MREVVDAYMASYAGRDGALAQRLDYWVETIGAVRIRELDADLVADHLEQLTAQPVHKYVGKDANGRRLYRAHHARAGSTVNRYPDHAGRRNADTHEVRSQISQRCVLAAAQRAFLCKRL